MEWFQKFRAFMKEKNGQKLACLTALTALFVACILLSAIILLNYYSKLKLLNEHFRDVPMIVKEREEELETRSRVFREEILARGELGLKIYKEEKESVEIVTLERIRRTVSAESVSLADESGEILNTTGPVIPTERFEERVRTLEPRTPEMEIYQVPSADGEETGEEDGKVCVMFPAEKDSGRRLVFEFSCEPLMEVYHSVGDWNSILGRIVSGLDAYAFVQAGGEEPVGYPLDDLAEAEREQLKQEVSELLQRPGRFVNLGGECSYNLVFLLHRVCFAVLLPYPEKNASFLLVMPLWSFISTGVFCAAALSIFIVINLILFSLYASKLIEQRYGAEDREEFLRESGRITRPGRFLMLAAIGCFSVLLLLLESRATTAYICMTKRMALQYEIVRHEKQEELIRSSYTESYLTRAQAAAKLLTEHKEHRTRSGLLKLCDTLKAEYLMLFDENGHELISSNSYTGFSAAGPNANLSEEYRAVLLGYPYAVVGPEKDPYTGKEQIGAAILLTGEEGQADGFLLAVFDGKAMSADIKKISLENTVNTFAVGEGYQAALVNKETGLFLAHTDTDMIGYDAEYYIAKDAYADDYEGFTEYNDRKMYVSGVTDGKKSLLFMVPERSDDRLSLAAFLTILLVLFILGCLYCPKACALCAAPEEGAAEAKVEEEAENAEPDKKNPVWVFVYGYIVFFAVLAGVAFVSAYTMIWPAFTFVFGGMWSRGFHLFALWAALFFLAVTLCVAVVIHRILEEAEKQTNFRTRSVLMLVDSFVAYATGILLIVGILYMFGVNTMALLASAGIVSIAVGMGSKDMVADILAGLFFAIEDTIHMGDVVTIGSWKGRVTDMGIRTTKITDDSQNVKILNNSHISDVINMSRQKTACVLELVLERSLNMHETEMIVRQAVESAMEEIPELHGSLQLEGIYNITPENFTARLAYACAEVERAAVTKRLQAFIKQHVLEEMMRGHEQADDL